MSKELEDIKKQVERPLPQKASLLVIGNALKDLDTIKKIFDDYDLEFKLTTLREAIFLLKQLQSEKSQCWDNALKKLKVLEIIREIGFYEIDYMLCVGYDTYCESRDKPIEKEKYDLLKEVLNNEK